MVGAPRPAHRAGASGETIPRLLVGGVQSGVGKTTFTAAILAALRRRGLHAAAFKAGPDYIDPTYLSRAAGRPCRNLDTWLLAPAAVRELFGRAASGADVAVVEGVMGLFDGRGGSGASGEGEDEGSSAHLAKLLDAPVLLAVDASASSRTAAAVVLGCQRFDPDLRLAGVLLSGIAGERHLELVAGPIQRATGLPILGSLPTRPDLALPARHLGLVPAGEQGVGDSFFDRLAAQAEATLDLDAILSVARAAPPLPDPSLDAAPPASRLFPPEPLPAKARIAVAMDDAFHFYYEDALDLLRAHGAELLPFSPLTDSALPDGAGAVYLGGGFPEVFAAELSSNAPMLASIRAAAARGTPILAECGGLMYLGRDIVDAAGARHDMAGVVPLGSTMGAQRVTLGYRIATSRQRSVLLGRGRCVRGHEFHWSTLDGPVAAELAAYDVTAADGRPIGTEGVVAGPADNVLASYVHVHLGSHADLAPAFVATAGRVR